MYQLALYIHVRWKRSQHASFWQVACQLTESVSGWRREHVDSLQINIPAIVINTIPSGVLYFNKLPELLGHLLINENHNYCSHYNDENYHSASNNSCSVVCTYFTFSTAPKCSKTQLHTCSVIVTTYPDVTPCDISGPSHSMSTDDAELGSHLTTPWVSGARGNNKCSLYHNIILHIYILHCITIRLSARL